MAGIDIERIKQEVDILPLVELSTTLKRVAYTHGGEWAGACPFCGGSDRFRVQPYHDGGGRWLCRGCTDAKWQDVINLVQRRDNCDFKTACKTLGYGNSNPADSATRPSRRAPLREPAQPPDETWQVQARTLIDAAHARLWNMEDTAATKARYYLKELRGLNATTINQHQLGYWPGGKIGDMYAPRGITIPCADEEGTLWYVKIRYLPGEEKRKPDGSLEKYTSIGGSMPAVYLSEQLAGKQVAVLAEGEFDALLLWQECGDMVGVASLGSATARLDLLTWGYAFFPLHRIITIYDTDGAGAKGSEQLAELSSRIQVARLPMLQEGDKDLTDFWKAGGNLRAWLEVLLAPPVVAVEQEEDWQVDEATYQARIAEYQRRHTEQMQPTQEQIADAWCEYYNVCLQTNVPLSDAENFATIMAAVLPDPLWHSIEWPQSKPEDYPDAFPLPSWEADTGVICFKWHVYEQNIKVA